MSDPEMELHDSIERCIVKVAALKQENEALRARLATLEKWYTAWGTEHSHHDCAACAAVDALRAGEGK